MPLIPLGRTGLMVSNLCLGTMTWGTQNTQSDGHDQIAMALTTPGARTRASSSLRIACSISESPAPPYSFGQAAPRNPAPWSFRCQARIASRSLSDPGAGTLASSQARTR